MPYGVLPPSWWPFGLDLSNEYSPDWRSHSWNGASCHRTDQLLVSFRMAEFKTYVICWKNERFLLEPTRQKIIQKVVATCFSYQSFPKITSYKTFFLPKRITLKVRGQIGKNESLCGVLLSKSRNFDTYFLRQKVSNFYLGRFVLWFENFEVIHKTWPFWKQKLGMMLQKTKYSLEA